MRKKGQLALNRRVLFVDGDETIVEKVNTMLKEMGHQVPARSRTLRTRKESLRPEKGAQ